MLARLRAALNPDSPLARFCAALTSGSPRERLLRNVFAAVACLMGLVGYALVVHAHIPVQHWLLWRLAPLWGYSLLFLLSSLGIGLVLLRRVLRLAHLPPVEEGLFGVTLGSIAFVFGMYLAGVVGWIRPWYGLVMPAALFAGGLLELPRWLSRLKHDLDASTTPKGTMRWLWLTATGVGAMCIVLLYLLSLTPDSISFDATWYHLPIGQDYARAGRIVPFYGDVNRSFPHFASMLYAWGFSVPGMLVEQRWMMALHLEFVFVLGKVVGVAALARYLLQGERVPGLWAAFFLFPSLFVQDQNPGGSADHFLGFFAAPVLLASMRFAERFDRRYAVLLGASLGGAMLVKYQAVYHLGMAAAVVVPRAAYLLARAASRALKKRRRPLLSARRVLVAGLITSGVALGTAAPHLIKNTIYHNNPVYPLAQRVFTRSYPQHARSAEFMEKAYPNAPYLPKGKGLERQLIAAGNFFTFSFSPHYSFTRYVPSMGSLFTLLLPMLLVIRGRRRPALAAWATFAGIWMWSNTYTADRYLQGMLAVPIAAAAALLVRTWQLGTVARLGLVPLVVFQIVWSGDVPFYSGPRRLESALSLIRSTYEKRWTDAQRFKFRQDHRAINGATPPDARILARNYRTTLGIEREIIFDIQAWQSLIFYEPVRGPAELYAHYRSVGITHILYPPNQRPPDTLQAAVLFNELVHRYATEKRRFGSLQLVTMPKEPPPADELPYQVLALGAPGYYTDGLYPVEALHILPKLQPPKGQEPKPARAWPKDTNAQAALLDAAEAVVLGKNARNGRNVKLDGVFFAAERFKNYTVYLRQQRDTSRAEPPPEPPTAGTPPEPPAAGTPPGSEPSDPVAPPEDDDLEDPDG
ncbi:hypothetical protein WMF11_44480 [Sorangium sp. So ce295]|uniref:hypothetical protein n=1 Tax=Sorangium sp. So ce295 TaxID=3133295 RepID=UPI003F637027